MFNPFPPPCGVLVAETTATTLTRISGVYHGENHAMGGGGLEFLGMGARLQASLLRSEGGGRFHGTILPILL